MDVKIKQNGTNKTFTLIDSWSDVTLEKWVQLNEIDALPNSQKALETVAKLSTIPKKLLKQLDIKDIAGIMNRLAKYQHDSNTDLLKIITIDEIEYGFHPDLDCMTLGEYADLETYIQDGTEKHLCDIMAILYRPITEKKGHLYKVEAYDGDIRLRAEEMKKMSAEEVQSALVFFWSLVSVFIQTIPSYLITEMTETITQ